jgi:4-diphosphocytidyl-2-C-methyl-D-erythritol kinase
VKTANTQDTISSISLKAPAKINLFLKVLNRRADGYHEIESLMQKITLFDGLHLSRQGETISLSCPDTDLPEDEGNIVYRAARAFFTATGASGGVDIVLKKNIPIAAGLGGGSSDAAAVVVGLNELCNTALSQAQMMDIVRPLGADVPFFIKDCSAAIATGIGDRLEPVEPVSGCSFVIVNPGFGVSTKWVYENFPLTSTSNPYILARGQNGSGKFYAESPGFFEKLGNDLEVVTISRHPEIGEIKSELKKGGAAASLMSGSGPTVFGLFFNGKDAQRCFNELGKIYGGNVFLAGPHIP